MGCFVAALDNDFQHNLRLGAYDHLQRLDLSFFEQAAAAD